MKVPKIRNCPCCDVSLVSKIPSLNAAMQTVATITEINAIMVEPVCQYTLKANGGVDTWILFWKCKQCGCLWQHGQFDKEEATSA